MTIFENYSNAQTLSEIDTILSKHQSDLHRMQAEEVELITQIKKVRTEIEERKAFLGEVKNFTQDFLKTVTDPAGRAKIAAKHSDKYLKRHRVQEFALLQKKRSIIQDVEEAERFAATNNFDPNSARSSYLRGNLEKKFMEALEYSDDPEMENTRLKVRELLTGPYTPRLDSKKLDSAKIGRETLESQMNNLIDQAFTKHGIPTNRPVTTIDMTTREPVV